MKGLGLTSLRALYGVSLLLTLPVFVTVLCVLGVHPALGVLFGSFFGIINTWLISLITNYTIHPDRRNPFLAAVTLIIKLPVLYGLLLFGFYHRFVDPLGFGAGFGAFLAALLSYLVVLGVRMEKARATQGGDS